MLFSELPYLCRRFFATVSVSLCIFAIVSVSPYLCRRICAIVSLPPFLRPVAFLARQSFPLLHVRISPSLPSRFPIYRAIPTFRRCAVSLHFLLTFRRCAEAALPREPPVSAFPHPSCHSHLPKVSRFPTFSTHLPKVRRSRTAPRAACSRISPSIVPFPPSEGVQFPYIFYSPSEGAQKPHCLENHL